MMMMLIVMVMLSPSMALDGSLPRSVSDRDNKAGGELELMIMMMMLMAMLSPSMAWDGSLPR